MMNVLTFLKKRFSTFSLFMLLFLISMGMKAQTPYAVWCKDSGTLYFLTSRSAIQTGQTFNSEKITMVWDDAKLLQSGTNPAWNITVRSDLQKVVFMQSFKEVKPTTLCEWFYRCGKLKSIEGIEYLNTASATSTKEMFRECTSLTSIDLKNFDTGNVTAMDYMFYGCTGLISLDVGYLNTSNVTNMDYMFGNCSGLESVNFYLLSGYRFYTSKVQSMVAMFSNCSKLKRLSLSLFDTSKVTRMNSMFYNCASITSIDLRFFSTASVTDMSSMFASCSNLQKIICNNTWSASSSMSMFQGCTSLKGAIAYNPQKLTVDYANPTNGYFFKYTSYLLYVNGQQVDNENCDNITSFEGVEGSISYNPQTNTLTLGDCSITSEYTSYALSSAVSGLVISVDGTAVVRGASNGVQLSGNTTITSANGKDAQLQVYAQNGAGIHFGNATLNINGGVQLTSRGTTYGISGYYTNQGGTYFGDLVVGGKNTIVYAFGTTNGCISLVKSLTLNDALAISVPENAAFQMSGGTGSVCAADGTTVKGQNVIIQYVEPVEEYDLYICGTRVTSKNCSSLREDIEGISTLQGSPVVARFDPESNTLSLSNVAISSDQYSAIETSIDGLNIVVNGQVNLKTMASGKYGLNISENTTISGAGSGAGFTITSPAAAVYLKDTLMVENVNLMARGGDAGIEGIAPGRVSRDYLGTLIAFNKNTVITVYGESACIKTLNELVLNDGLQITQPEKAYFSAHYVRLSRMEFVGGQNVVIQYVGQTQLKGDVNLDGNVDISDIVAVINTIAGDSKYLNTANVNGDNSIDISDIVAIINIIAGL